MDTYEVTLTTMKQYTARGDGPIIALEDEKFICVYVIVDGYQFCYKHVKSDSNITAVFKQEYLNNPRVIFPIRKVKEQSVIKLSVDEKEEDDRDLFPEAAEEEEVVSLVDEDNTEAISQSQSQEAEEVTMLSIDTNVVG